jgi:hypothetical protein
VHGVSPFVDITIGDAFVGFCDHKMFINIYLILNGYRVMTASNLE